MEAGAEAGAKAGAEAGAEAGAVVEGGRRREVQSPRGQMSWDVMKPEEELVETGWKKFG